MSWWSNLSALGGLNVTALLALAVAAWLAGARRRRLALSWCLLFGAAMGVAAASQLAFMGWGVGIRALDFTGFSGHAARAAAVFPVALFLLLERQGARPRHVGVGAGALLGVAVALARVRVGAHAPAEAVAGCLLGLAVAAIFIVRALALDHALDGARGHAPRPLLLAVLAATLLLPRADPVHAHGWLTGAALLLSGHDRAWQRPAWRPASAPYVPPCARDRIRHDYFCL